MENYSIGNSIFVCSFVLSFQCVTATASACSPQKIKQIWNSSRRCYQVPRTVRTFSSKGAKKKPQLSAGSSLKFFTLSVFHINNFSLLGGFGSGLNLAMGKGHKWDGYRLFYTKRLSHGCLELGSARPFDKQWLPLLSINYIPSGTIATPSSPSASSEMLCSSNSSMAMLNQSWRICIPLGAGWGQCQGEGDLSLMKDGGTLQLHHWISMPGTHGSQCQMV